MKYRREIDGLRAIAVMAVLLNHSEFGLFRGGFVGVDIFFVISGYLITSIIIKDLENGDFSIAKFYERRARRILPTLFLVMLSTVPFAYMWMMPEDFKNYGQSLVATTLFANNILLTETSGYWDAASSFKPFLHTWSLALEEQYYIIFPICICFIHKMNPKLIYRVLLIALLFSLALAILSVTHYPVAAFYNLPTRAWELLVGALSTKIRFDRSFSSGARLGEGLCLAGLAMIFYSIVALDSSYPSPSSWTIVPVIGSAIIIIFSVEGTISQRILAAPIMTGIGLISYSLYLWHQPLFSFARVFSKSDPSTETYVVLICVCSILSLFSWKFIEVPFRDREKIGNINFIIFVSICSLFFVAFGLYLDRTYGMYWRFFGISESVSDLDKRLYNERAFVYKRSDFSNDQRLKILVIGNSFGRDIVNMTRETYGNETFDLVYSDALSVCIGRSPGHDQSGLFDRADVIVFASGYVGREQDARHCVARDIDWAKDRGKAIFYFGTKNFGFNLNWITRLPPSRRANQYNVIPKSTLEEERAESSVVPPMHFISLLDPVMKGGKIPITDGQGKPISTDRMHVTKYGAIYFGNKVIKPSLYGDILGRSARLRSK